MTDRWDECYNTKRGSTPIIPLSIFGCVWFFGSSFHGNNFGNHMHAGIKKRNITVYAACTEIEPLCYANKTFIEKHTNRYNIVQFLTHTNTYNTI